MAKYSVSGYLHSKFPFERVVEADNEIEAEAKAVEEARSDIEQVFNIVTSGRPTDIYIMEEE